MICMQPLGKTRSRPWENWGARQYHSDRTHRRRGGFGGSSRKTIGSLVVRSDKTWYHLHPTTRATLRSWNLGLNAASSHKRLVGSCLRISRGGRGGSDRFRSSCLQTGSDSDGTARISNDKSASVYRWSSGDRRFGMSNGQNESCSGPEVLL